MSLNKIDVEVTPENEAQVIQHIRDSRALLDFLIGLAAKEKRRLPKLSPSLADFVTRFRYHAEKFPTYLPQQITVEHFDRDFNTCGTLERVSTEIKSFDRDLDDTILLLKSEYYQTARVYYRSAKSAAKEGDKDAERIAADLAEYYKRQSAESEEPTEAPAAPAPSA